jgi:uncharacterized protein (TIGR02145 family)
VGGVYGGNAYSTSVSNTGSTAYYWSSTENGSTAYGLYFDTNGYVYPQLNDGKRVGFQVRCVK